ncbi:MAG: acetyl-CoA carboxylase biotin carboxyl carrier protein [Candidatus Marinimicrobia bacterium]|nr:acetyl-CoA carboxylase biotin carboxyl carrier protein [Candidatus Neomarinimicrobiota bacterium]
MLQDKIKSLIDIIEGTEINELEVSSFWGAQKIRLQKNLNLEVSTSIQPTVSSESKSVPAPASPIIEPMQPIAKTPPIQEPEADIVPTNAVEIIAPLVGTFYQSAKPGSPAFVKEGDIIQVGQTICIIEAMKIFNEIEAEVSGKVVKIIVNDSSPVEYGQALMLVEPS